MYSETIRYGALSGKSSTLDKSSALDKTDKIGNFVNRIVFQWEDR